MRILLMTLGSRGDVQPFIALGQGLKARGHDVALSTARNFTDMIEDAGLRPMPVSVDMQAVLEDTVLSEGMRSWRGLIKAWRMSQELMTQQLNDVWQAAQAEQPDAIIYHPKAVSAAHSAKAVGAVAMPAYLQPAYTLTGAFLNPIFQAGPFGPGGGLFTKPLNRLFLGLTRLGYSSLLKRWRSENDDVPRGTLNVLLGYHPDGKPVPRLHAYSPHLVPRPADFAPEEHITGYWFLESADDWQPPADLAAFLDAGLPPVYVGFGSMPSEDAAEMTRMIVAGLDRAGVRGVIGTGWKGLDAVEVPEGHFALEAAPHGWLFPRCAAVVHHGGAGTTHEGLRWGRPSVICPVFGDQPFWGNQVAAAGAGPKPVRQKKLTPRRLARQVRRALTSTTVQDAEDIGGVIRAERGVGQAVSLIEETVAR